MKNVEMNLLNMFPRNMGIIKSMYLNGVLGEKEYQTKGDERVSQLLDEELRQFEDI